MRGLYSSPLRVYLILGALTLFGLIAGGKLPISLYPNSNKPTIWSSVSYGSMNAEEFVHNYGSKIENSLKAIQTDDLEVINVTSDYGKSNASFNIEFQWGSDPKSAKREVQNLMTGLSSAWPKEVRDSLNVNYWSKSSGFIAISFYSEKRDLNSLFKVLEPALVPQLSSVNDAEGANLWNPGQKEITITLDPDSMATLNLFPRDIERAIKSGLNGYIGGTITVGTNRLQVEMPRQLESVKKLKEVLVPTNKGQLIHLSQIAHIDYGEATDSNKIFKTNGSKSLILFANPRTGGNVKRMAEDILSIVKKAMPSLPKDIQYRVLVDPSEFIRASVNNVIHEVIIAAGLAVLVLFLFIGSFKNTITAALEIPLSMVLAFILMNLFEMNLNLISLGGLALAAGMNVDASVVVMENIFRHMEGVKGPLNFNTRLSLIIRAVKEVRLPIIASTISTLVVFLPLALTKDLTNAILGDLAKAVVFSHAFSMFIALILVPTIRLQIMNSSKNGDKAPVSPINGLLTKVETFYSKILRSFINFKATKWLTLTGIVTSLLIMSFLLVPKLKKEIIGTPDTDWMILSVNTHGNTLVAQMESQASEYEERLLGKFGKDIKYTFTQIRRPNQATIMARLENKKEMDRVWKDMEEEFQNQPGLYFWVGPWNPAELPLPDPPHMRLIVRGGDVEDRMLLAKDLMDTIREKDAFPRAWTKPNVHKEENIVLSPHTERWQALAKEGAKFLPFDITDLSRVATEGRVMEYINIGGDNLPIKVRYPKGTLSTKEDLEALPIGVGDKIIPLRSIVDVKLKEAKSRIYRENGRDLVIINAKRNKGEDAKIESSLAKAKEIANEYRSKDLTKLGLTTKPMFYFEDAQKDLNSALKQLSTALALSLLLIFLTMLLQFGDIGHCLIIMVAIPLGIFGGSLSLWLFNSTLSLNSVLGIILLNGIAVNNSIILVDFILSLHREGFTPIEAAIMASKKRLRPILITSLTTILGMLPIALGLGEGGKILQPLGLSVAGGLWFSMLFTLFIVPMLEVLYLNTKKKIDFKETNLPPSLETIVELNNTEERENQISSGEVQLQ
ncbi:MAG: efflux RND transporter permease subunit [Bacteriovoracaceae bacterium]|nr:efflux RND transporter permease subunit [Bacteriovoracaceae bacterium]